MALPYFFKEIQRQETPYYTARRHINTHLDSSSAKEIRIKRANEIKARNDSAPVIAQERNNKVKFDIRIGKASAFGAYMRSFWGDHPIFEIDLRKQDVRVNDYLKAFPQENPGWATRLKRDLLFSSAVTQFLRSEMASDYNHHRGISENALLEMLKDIRYNFVITPDEIIIARVDGKTVSWALSKHCLLANYADNVVFAGEFWKHDGKIYINNNSGTYKPTAEELEAAVSFLQALAPNLSIVGELHVEN
jgi:hypothetical protein